MKHVCVIAAVVAAVALVDRSARLGAQSDELAAARVNHLGVTVPDIDKAVKE